MLAITVCIPACLPMLYTDLPQLLSLLAVSAPLALSQELENADYNDYQATINITKICTPARASRSDSYFVYANGGPDLESESVDMPLNMSLGMHFSTKWCTAYMGFHANQSSTEEVFSFLENFVDSDSPYYFAETQNVIVNQTSATPTTDEDDFFDSLKFNPYLRHLNGSETYAEYSESVACSTVNITTAIDAACDSATGKKGEVSINAGKNVTVVVTGKTADPLKVTIAAFKKSTVKADECKKELKTLVETYTWRAGPYYTPAGNVTAGWSYSQDGNVKTKLEWVNRESVYSYQRNGDNKQSSYTKLNCVKGKGEDPVADVVAGGSGTNATAGKEDEKSAAAGMQMWWSVLSLSVAAAGWMLV